MKHFFTLSLIVFLCFFILNCNNTSDYQIEGETETKKEETSIQEDKTQEDKTTLPPSSLKTVIAYDEKGNKIETQFEDNHKIKTSFYIEQEIDHIEFYDLNGNIIKYTQYDPLKKLLFNCECKNGNYLIINNYSYYSYLIYEYNTKNQIVRFSKYEWGSTVIFDYQSTGNNYFRILYDEDQYINCIEEYYENNIIAKKTNYDWMLHIISQQIFDESGRLISFLENDYFREETILFKYICKEGNYISLNSLNNHQDFKITEFNNEGKIIRFWQYQYEHEVVCDYIPQESNFLSIINTEDFYYFIINEINENNKIIKSNIFNLYSDEKISYNCKEGNYIELNSLNNHHDLEFFEFNNEEKIIRLWKYRFEFGVIYEYIPQGNNYITIYDTEDSHRFSINELNTNNQIIKFTIFNSYNNENEISYESNEGNFIIVNYPGDFKISIDEYSNNEVLINQIQYDYSTSNIYII